MLARPPGRNGSMRRFSCPYNRERPHRGLALLPPEPPNAGGPAGEDKIERRDRLGGLIHEYHRAAA
jgi:hypothetical protein